MSANLNPLKLRLLLEHKLNRHNNNNQTGSSRSPTFASCASCAALRATKAIPKQDLHVNQMDSAWVDYLPGHEIRCK
ncbi:hypothetical protein CesoFtcFv8_020777 [Champsocephalus esox]|uniref:Uncharacterized protein n=1 Tax=Champsocephalus esox TaxID=159716 RepID=A0AAN8BBG9_9TELE|nr:hypothetical protein CesoFtcFv8_020777 [Champsocephalus esox]